MRYWHLLVGLWLVVGAPGVAAADPPAPEAVGGAVIVYDAAFFAAHNPKTALDMIQWIPGFTLSLGDASVRGFAGSAGNVLIDGERPVDKQFNLTQILERINADQVAYIQLIRGGAAGIDMLGQTVLANIVRKKNAADSGALTLGYSYYRDGHNLPLLTLEGTHQGAGGTLLTGAASVSRYQSLGTGKGPQIRTDGAGTPISRDAINVAAGGTTAYAYGVVETPFQAGQLHLNANTAWTDFNRRTLDMSLEPAGGNSLLRDHLGGPLGAQLTGEIGASFKRKFGTFESDSLMLLRLKGQSYSSALTAGAQNQLFDEQDHSGEAIVRTEWQHSLGRAAAEISFEGAYNWLGTRSDFHFDGFLVPLPNARAKVGEIRGELAGKLTWPVNPALQMEAGLRLEHSRIESDADIHQEKDLFFPKPRLAATYTPNRSSQWRLRVEHEVGQLDFTNFVAASALDSSGVHSGNTDILPQQAWVFEGAYEYRFWRDGSAGLTLRHSLIANAIDRVPVRDPSGLGAAFDAPGNIGRGSLDTLHLDLALPLGRLGLDGASLKASGILQWSEVKDPTTGMRRGISDMRAVEYSLEFRQDLPGSDMAWGGSLVTSCWSATSNDDCSRIEYRFNEIDNYSVGPALGVFVEYRPRADLFLRMEANNLLPARYGRQVDSYAGPRDLYALAFREDRRLQTAPFLHLSLRKNL